MDTNEREKSIDMHWGVGAVGSENRKCVNDDLIMAFKNLGVEFDLIKYSAKHGSSNIDEVAITVSRKKDESSAPYWVIGILGGVAIILFFVSIVSLNYFPQKVESSISVEAKIHEEQGCVQK